MNCAYHNHNAAVVSCSGCGKPLCPACDHRVKGFPYCQDCIVSGVELLRNYHQAAYVPIVKKQTSPFVSTVLSFICPGLGAAYNGQTSKALVHFAVVVGLFQMAVLTGFPIFAFGVLGMWLYAMVDAYKTAKLIRAGVTPDGAEDILVQRISGNPKLWGIVLTVLGVSFLLNTFFNFRFLMRGILPILLIGLGIYLLRDYVFKNKDIEPKWNSFETRGDAPAFVSAINENSLQTGEFETRDDISSIPNVKMWKNR